MKPELAVDAADRMARKRSIVIAIAAAAFLIVQLVARPFFFREGGEPATRTQIVFWAVNALVLLLALATGGGLGTGRQIRDLVNDDVSRANQQKAIATGYWVGMAAALAIYALHGVHAFTGREAAYAIVTASLLAALSVFSYLEYRALGGT